MNIHEIQKNHNKGKQLKDLAETSAKAWDAQQNNVSVYVYPQGTIAIDNAGSCTHEIGIPDVEFLYATLGRILGKGKDND